jgi:hypothetical protein
VGNYIVLYLNKNQNLIFLNFIYFFHLFFFISLQNFNLRKNTNTYKDFIQNYRKNISYYWFRFRFKILGMGYFFRLKNLFLLITFGKTHDLLFPKLINVNYNITGYKQRILVIYCYYFLKIIKNLMVFLLNFCKSNNYRRKGVGFYNNQYKFKIGKKKYI